MKLDKRKPWTHKGCQIEPVELFLKGWQFANNPGYVDFGDNRGCQSRYWKVNYPDKTWVCCGTRTDCIENIDTTAKKRPERFDKTPMFEF